MGRLVSPIQKTKGCVSTNPVHSITHRGSGGRDLGKRGGESEWVH